MPNQQDDEPEAKTKIVNLSTNGLTASSFERWWESKSVNVKRNVVSGTTASEREEVARNSYNLLGVGFFAFMGLVLFWYSRRD